MQFDEALMLHEINIGYPDATCSVYVILGPDPEEPDECDYYVRHPRSLKIVGPVPAAISEEVRHGVKRLLERLGITVHEDTTVDD